MLRTHDNWERLVAAVIKKQQLWELFHAHSRSPSVLSEASSSDFITHSSSFREIDNASSSAYRQELEDAVAGLENHPVRKLVFGSDFVEAAFDVEDIEFTSMELLGRGTFCNTYVGDVNNDWVKIVVKRVKQVAVSEVEFKRSMVVVGRLRHENIVPLRAFYCSEDQKLMLYDYYSQGSVHQLLHGKINNLGWKARLRIAVGAGRGLASLHAQNLVHGNVKSSNIFLNGERYGCISDYGIINLTSAKLMKSALCYAPEVNNTTLNCSQQSDVYSFGILLFELLTRKSPVSIPGGPEAVDLVKLMKSVKSHQMSPKVFDADLLRYTTIREQMVKVLEIGISCIVKTPQKRPKMSEVARMLDDRIRSVPKSNSLVFVHQNNESTYEDPMDLEDIIWASSEVLGYGTFGTSYKVSLDFGRIVRVKKLKDVNVTSAEFRQHVDKISRIKHKYGATAIMAYYFSKVKVLLISDYHEEECLSTLLRGTFGARNRKYLPWKARLKIALTSAKSIHHIHASKLVHGNIRSSNIFLDRTYSATIADIALYKVTKPINYDSLKDEGYIGPEVRDTWDVSQASDVYSFGVVLLGLLTGQSPKETMRDDQAILFVEWVQNHVLAETLRLWFHLELDTSETVEVLQLALGCISTFPERRPMMSEVVDKLKEISGLYDEEAEPSTEYGWR